MNFTVDNKLDQGHQNGYKLHGNGSKTSLIEDYYWYKKGTQASNDEIEDPSCVSLAHEVFEAETNTPPPASWARDPSRVVQSEMSVSG